jgi:hypothetical protein
MIVLPLALALNVCESLADPTPNDQPSAITLPAADVAHVADKIRPLLPKGWAIKVEDDQIDVMRAEVVEVYNGVGLPYGPNDPELKEYVKPNVSTKKFQITLRLAARMTAEEYQKINVENSRAKERATPVISGEKIEMHQFLIERPEYGYRELPTFLTDNEGIYLTTSLHPFLRFYNDEVGKECNGLLERVSGLFQHYGSKPAQKPAPTTAR